MPEEIEHPEKSEGKIPIEFTVFLSAHETAEDIRGFREAFEETDIYVPEIVGWTMDDLRLFRNLSAAHRPDKSRGERDKLIEENFESLTPDGNEAQLEELETIYCSGKPIIILDIPRDSFLYQERLLLDDLLVGVDKDFVGGNFNGSLAKVRNYEEKYAEYQKQREEYMVSRARTEIEKLIQATPALRSKTERGEKLKVLIKLGRVHTGVYHQLRKGGEEAREKFKELPLIFSYVEEMSRDFFFGKKSSDELIARCLMQAFLADLDVFGKMISEDNDKIFRVLRKLVSVLSLQDIKDVSEALGRGGDLLEEVEKRGVKIPKTKEEFEAMDKEIKAKFRRSET